MDDAMRLSLEAISVLVSHVKSGVATRPPWS